MYLSNLQIGPSSHKHTSDDQLSDGAAVCTAGLIARYLQVRVPSGSPVSAEHQRPCSAQPRNVRSDGLGARVPWALYALETSLGNPAMQNDLVWLRSTSAGMHVFSVYFHRYFRIPQ